MPEKIQKLSWSEKFSYFARLFWLYFCAPKTKSTSQARIKPKILSTLGLNPTEKPGPTYDSGWAYTATHSESSFHSLCEFC